MGRPKSPARAAAVETGAQFYIGPACQHGHSGERYTSTNACRQCVREQPRPDRARKRKRPVQADDFEALLEKGN